MNTITLRNENALAEIVPERGGLITRFALTPPNGPVDELLYLDPATLADPAQNVRGGIPILFPIAGKSPGITEATTQPLRQHGFARNLPFTVTAVTEAALTMRLTHTPATLAQFPYPFHLTLTVTLAPNALTLDIQIANPGSRPLPVHFGLHPYFHLPIEAKPGAAITTAATTAFDNRTGQTVPYQTPDFATGETDLHLTNHSGHQTRFTAPNLAPRLIEWDSFLPILVLWTQPAKPFLCIEPWSALAGELANPQRWLAPGGTTGGFFRITV